MRTFSRLPHVSTIAMLLGAVVAGACAHDAPAGDLALDPGPLPDVVEGSGQRYRPPPGVTWYWQLQGRLPDAIDAELVDIDLFDTSTEQVAALRGRGHRVICYFSAGSHEEWRSDADAFPPAAVGRPLDGWPGERWLDTRDPDVRDRMRARLDLAVERGCDGVEPDNVDGFLNRPGFDLTARDTVDYLAFLVAEARMRGLSIGLKNLPELAGYVEPLFDWALSEQCAAYSECDAFGPFVAAGKAVLHVEYVDRPEQIEGSLARACAPGSALGLSTAVATWDLDGAWRLCR